MTADSTDYVFRSDRDPRIRYYAALVMTVAITVLGAGMMALTSSPAMKGAAFLWLPAAIQLIAGIWLGPILGGVVGGVGAYAAGILAYGGWGPPDIIMNLVAGSLANASLPSILFRVFRVDPTLGGRPTGIAKGVVRIVLLLVVVVGIALIAWKLNLGWKSYILAALVLIAAPFLLRDLKVRTSDLLAGILIVTVISAISAAIGCVGAVVGGQSWRAAIVGVGTGWFLGDTVSCLLGLVMLASFTERARRAGFAR